MDSLWPYFTLCYMSWFWLWFWDCLSFCKKIQSLDIFTACLWVCCCLNLDWLFMLCVFTFTVDYIVLQWINLSRVIVKYPWTVWILCDLILHYVICHGFDWFWDCHSFCKKIQSLDIFTACLWVCSCFNLDWLFMLCAFTYRWLYRVAMDQSQPCHC